MTDSPENVQGSDAGARESGVGDANIQVEVTDPKEFHCFRLLLNPNGHEPGCSAGIVRETGCWCHAKGNGVRLEIMFHARSLVDLIHKCSLALCDWQAATSADLIERLQAQLSTPDSREPSAEDGTHRRAKQKP